MRNSLIDVSKFIAAILVVLIHTALFDETGTFIWQFDSILRLAVPFFIICSGYYLGKNINFRDKKAIAAVATKGIFLSFLKKMCSIYIIWSLLYLIVYIPSWIESGWFSVHAFVDWGIAAILQGSYYHLWYILFMIYALIALAFVIKVIPIDRFPVVALLLYMIEVIQYGYRGFLPENVQKCFAIFDDVSCLSAITRVLPILMLGMYIANKNAKYKNPKVYLIGFLISFVCLAFERNILVSLGQESVSYIFFTLPVTYLLFRTLINLNFCITSFNTKLLSQISTYIYLIHPAFIVLLSYFSIKDELMKCLGVIILSIASSYVIVFCKNINQHRRFNNSC